MRPQIDVTYLRWLLGAPGSIALGIEDADGRWVGFELAVERNLVCAGRTLRACYATLLTVSPAHRRRGLGRWLLDGLHGAARARGADVVLATFEGAHAGLPTVRAAVERTPGWALRTLQTPATWSRRLDRGGARTAPLPRARVTDVDAPAARSAPAL